MILVNRSPTLRLAFVIIVFGGVAIAASAAEPKSAAASTRPTTIATPAGCVRIDVGGRSFITDASDATWVTAVAEALRDRPATTQPTRLSENLRLHRESLVEMICSDFSELEKKDVQGFVENDLVAAVDSQSRAVAYPVFLILTDIRLTEIVRHGWAESHFHYNRQSDSVDISRAVTIRSTDPVESAVWIAIPTDDAGKTRRQKVSDTVSRTEVPIDKDFKVRVVTGAVRCMAAFFEKSLFADTSNSAEQRWFSAGLSNVLAARYVSSLMEIDVATLVADMTRRDAHGPVDEKTINLLNPYSADDLRPELLGFYRQGCVRKSVAVMFIWFNKVGIDKMAAVLAAVRRLPPADGLTLVKLIKEASDVDLGPLLSGRP